MMILMMMRRSGSAAHAASASVDESADLGVPHAGLQNLRNQSLTASHVELIVPFSAIVDFQ